MSWSRMLEMSNHELIGEAGVYDPVLERSVFSRP